MMRIRPLVSLPCCRRAAHLTFLTALVFPPLRKSLFPVTTFAGLQSIHLQFLPYWSVLNSIPQFRVHCLPSLPDPHPFLGFCLPVQPTLISFVSLLFIIQGCFMVPTMVYLNTTYTFSLTFSTLVLPIPA